MPRLEPLLTFQAELGEPLDVGATPTGARRIFDVRGGSFEGRTCGAAYCRAAPTGCETGDARHAWLQRVVAVGHGRLLRGGVAYRSSRW